MTAIRPPIRAPRKVLGSSLPTGRAATEDRASREWRTERVSGSSDIHPAGLTYNSPRETPRSGDSEARGVIGRGEAVGSVPDRPSSRSDSTRAAVPAREMEPHGGRARRDSSTATRRDVSLDVRLTKVEREAIRARARVLAVKPSAWARAVMLDALDQRSTLEASMMQTAHEAPSAELAEAVEQLRRVGVNLNTTLRKGQSVDAGMLRAVLGVVTEVRAALGDRTAP